MTFLQTFRQEFYGGSAAAAASLAAVSAFDVAINGRGYMLDLENQQAGGYKFESLPLLHKYILQDRGPGEIGENSLNPEDYWRRSVDSWANGAGQTFLDHNESVQTRYRQSKGIDPWTLGQLSLLPDTTQKRASANTNLALSVAGTYLYELDGTALVYTNDLSSFTTVTAAGGDASLSSAVSMTGDGYTIWVADGTRVHYTTRGTATFNKYHTADHVASLIHTTKGRLFTANSNVLYTHSGAAGSAVATAYYTHPNSDWAWTAIAGGSQAVYFAGYSGSKSIIYAATIMSDGTNLDVPVAVATLPTGEVVRSLSSYLDILMIGTDKGLRAAQTNSNGSVVLGSLISLSNAPQAFEAQDRFVWFGWTNYDTTSTGLGRCDLSAFNGDVPAYASDEMATTQGTVSGIATFLGGKVFTVQGQGLYAESTNKVASGTIYSGWAHYSLADAKLAIKLDVSHRAGAGSYTAAIAVDDTGTYTQCGNTVTTSSAAGNDEVLAAPQLSGRRHETRFTLARSGSDTTQGPVIDRWTLMVEPQVERRAKFMVPVQLATSVTNRNGTKVIYAPATERALFWNLFQARQPVTFQDVESSYTVVVDDFHWIPYENIAQQNEWAGTMVLELKVLN